MDFATKIKFNMKKILIILFIPIIFSCSDDSEDQNNNQTSELIGTYFFISGDECGMSFEASCDNTLTVIANQISATDLDPSTNCQSGPTRNFGEYDITLNDSESIEGHLADVNAEFFYNKSTETLIILFTSSSCFTTETWQKN
tara:strand:+ start:895 stop:1323 length:429 start_codon:yes stop_codon:yes gene_type:complete